MRIALLLLQIRLILAHVAALLLLSLGTWAQSAASPAGAAQSSAVIAGKALNGISGEPLSKVEIRIFAGRQAAGGGSNVYVARSDAAGTFRLEGVPAGNYFLMVSRRGFASANPDISGLRVSRRQGAGSMVEIAAGDSLTSVEIRLQPAGVITGQVVDEEGEPMSGVLIQAEQYRYIRGKKMLSATGRDTTDDRGMYRIYDLASGRYFVKAQGRSLLGRFMGAMRAGPGGAPGGGRMGILGAADEPMAYAETYYPNALAASEAIPLQLAPGSELGGIDFVLRPTPSYTISGAVSPLPALEEGAVLVSARKGDGAAGFGNAAGVAQANPRTGEFTLRNLTPGTYQVIARGGGRRRTNSSSGKVTVEVANRPVDNVTIPLQADVALNGIIRLPENFPADDLGRIAVSVESALGPGRAIARANADGNFSINVSPADTNSSSFTVENLPAGLYVQRMKLGGADLLALPAGQPVDPGGTLEVQLAANGASVTGFARNADGQPVPQARITLLPESQGHGAAIWRKTAVSAEDGSFQIADIAPGKYRVYGFEDLDADPSFDPDFLSNFGQRWKLLELKAGASATIDPPLIPASETSLYLGEVAP